MNIFIRNLVVTCCDKMGIESTLINDLFYKLKSGSLTNNELRVLTGFMVSNNISDSIILQLCAIVNPYNNKVDLNEMKHFIKRFKCFLK